MIILRLTWWQSISSIGNHPHRIRLCYCIAFPCIRCKPGNILSHISCIHSVVMCSHFYNHNVWLPEGTEVQVVGLLWKHRVCFPWPSIPSPLPADQLPATAALGEKHVGCDIVRQQTLVAVSVAEQIRCCLTLSGGKVESEAYLAFHLPVHGKGKLGHFHQHVWYHFAEMMRTWTQLLVVGNTHY